MAVFDPNGELDERFSSEGATPTSWVEVVAVLTESEMFWLSTVRGDGRPHVTPLPAMWLDGSLHFCTGPDEQKTRNIEVNPQCVLSTGGNEFRSGLDVVVEGRADRVTDLVTLQELAGLWKSKLDWAFDVVDGGFRDPAVSGGDPSTRATALVFSVKPEKVLGFAKGEAYAQTRFRF